MLCAIYDLDQAMRGAEAVSLTYTMWPEDAAPEVRAAVAKTLQTQVRDALPKDAPDLSTLIGWITEGGCEATDGCWVEEGGTCPHGHRSWLVELGLL